MLQFCNAAFFSVFSCVFPPSIMARERKASETSEIFGYFGDVGEFGEIGGVGSNQSIIVESPFLRFLFICVMRALLICSFIPPSFRNRSF